MSVENPISRARSVSKLLMQTLCLVVIGGLAGCDVRGLPKATPIPTPTLVPPATSTPAPPTPTATLTPRPTRSRITPTPMPTWYPVQGLNGMPPPYWREVGRVAPGEKQIALTFDAGGTGEPLPLILDALRERNIRVTMFFTGKFAEQYPEVVRQAAEDGHEIANHTYSHSDVVKLTDQKLREELARTEKVLRDLTGLSSKPYWRPPRGARNNRVLNVAASEGYRSIYWTLDAHDSVGQPKTADFIFDRITNTSDVELDGAIVLMHFGSEASAEALPRIFDRLEEIGLRVVTVSELLSPP